MSIRDTTANKRQGRRDREIVRSMTAIVGAGSAELPTTTTTTTTRQWGWVRKARALWTRWRLGVPDDRQEGLELGTVRTVSCPVFPKYKPTPLRDSPVSVAVGVPTEDVLEMGSLAEEDEFHEEPCDVRFVMRFANQLLPEEFHMEEGNVEELKEMCMDGVMPCLLLNHAVAPEMVDERALNVGMTDGALTVEERMQNHILCLNSLAAVSHSVSHNARRGKLSAEVLARGDEEAALELLRRIVHHATVEKIHVHRFPELRELQEEEEDIFHFLQCTPEELLLRWTNFTLTQSETQKRVSNLEGDLSDARIFLELQMCIEPELEPCPEGLDERQCAAVVLENCQKLGIETSHSVDDLLSGDVELNSVFLSQLFAKESGLTPQSDNAEQFETDVENFDDEGSREERSFRMWLNSLGCTTLCAGLFSADFRSGWMLLEVLESIQPHCIDWSQANKPPFKPLVSRIKSVENCNQVIRVAKECLHLSLVGIGGDDIADGKRKPILALVWQLLRLHTLMVLDSALEASSPYCGGFSPTAAATTGDVRQKLNEADLLNWANSMLDFSGSKRRITSFRDPELSNSLALLDLLKAIEPHAIQEKHITPGSTDGEKEMNAKYVLSVARKLGATIFIIWEDITEVKPKMLLLLIASFMLLDKQIRRLHKAASRQGRPHKETGTLL